MFQVSRVGLRRRGITAAAVVVAAIANEAPGQWPQWGGPERNFVVNTSGLAAQWPEDGPKRLWRRRLGSGFSSIVVDDGKLFTMYRKSKRDLSEYTVALDAATGKTVWKKRLRAVVPASTQDWGKEFSGPNSTPLVVGDRLFAVGRNAVLRCHQKSDGKVLWKRDLQEEFGAETQVCGYSPSPLAFGETVILPMGRREGHEADGHSLVAFDLTSGEIVWQRHTFQIGHSSPILITFDGKPQLVQCTKQGLIGVDPANGELLWEHKHPEPQAFEAIFATPVWDGKDTIAFSSAHVGCAVKLHAGADGTTTELLWQSATVPLGMGTPVLIGDMLVGPKHGRGSPSTRLFGVDIRTGDVLWSQNGFEMCVAVGGPDGLFVLDHNGVLSLAVATREGVTVRARHQLMQREALTAPTLVGHTLYVRDEKYIIALDLSAGTDGKADQPGNAG